MKNCLMTCLIVVLFLGSCSSKVQDDFDINPIENKDPAYEEPVDPQPEVLRSFINGKEVDNQSVQLFGIIIENSPAAWPHSGISQADVVYEVYVEGYSVTRLLAIFTQFPLKIGPVRSARLPFVWIMKEWMIPFAHYGSAQRGLGDAYTLIKNTKWPIRFDGVSGLNDDFYFRDNTRLAPHNAYFNALSAVKMINEQEIEERFKFEEIGSVSGKVATQIYVSYTTTNNIEYRYNELTKHYDRFINGKPMMDSVSNSQVNVKNIIIQYAKHSTFESIDYVLVDLIGSGKAVFFIDGQSSEGSWLRESDNTVTKYFMTDGSELVLSPGNTWIQVVSDRVKISFE